MLPNGSTTPGGDTAAPAPRSRRRLHGLSWRVGLPFVLLVVLEIVGLAVLLTRQIADEDCDRMVRVAEGHAHVIESSSLPPESEVARRLATVSGYEVFFRGGGQLYPPLPEHLAALPIATLPADREAHSYGNFTMVAIPIQGSRDLVILGEIKVYWLHPRVITGVVAFLLLAIVTAWFVVRGLVHPLRQLATRLPAIESPGPIDLPAAHRNDELGDLARSFLRTRQALHDEQAARQRAERLAALGRMTAALAHEVQNPVAAIRMHAQLWRGGHDEGAAAVIESEIARIDSLLSQWLFLTRPEPPVLTPIQVGGLLQDLVAMHRPHAEHAAVTVALDLEPDLQVQGDRRRLEQVFRNLIANALQAMPEGGRLAISARRRQGSVRVVFADSGAGFSPTALERHAEYFFSEREGGMGIGLSVAHEILKAHHGSLHVANGGDGGAVVTIEIPVFDPVSSLASSPAP